MSYSSKSSRSFCSFSHILWQLSWEFLFICLSTRWALTIFLYTRTNDVTIGMVLVRFQLRTKHVYSASYLLNISCFNCFCDQVVFVAVLLHSFCASFALFSCPMCPENDCECFTFGCFWVYLCLSSLLQATCQFCTWSLRFWSSSCFHIYLNY